MDNKEIKHIINVYKQILSHLEEHLKEGNYDNLDVSQAKMLINEIKRLTKLKGGTFIDLTFTKAKDIPENDPIYEWSNPKQAQKMAYKYLGKSAVIYKSFKPDKKYMIYDPNNDKMVHFGQMGFQSFDKHRDLNRRKNYLTRTANMKGDWADNPYSPNNLSRNILW